MCLYGNSVTVNSETRTNVSHHISTKLQEYQRKTHHRLREADKIEEKMSENSFEKLAGQSEEHQRLKYESNHEILRSFCCSYFPHPLQDTLSRYLTRKKKLKR